MMVEFDQTADAGHLKAPGGGWLYGTGTAWQMQGIRRHGGGGLHGTGTACKVTVELVPRLSAFCREGYEEDPKDSMKRPRKQTLATLAVFTHWCQSRCHHPVGGVNPMHTPQTDCPSVHTQNTASQQHTPVGKNRSCSSNNTLHVVHDAVQPAFQQSHTHSLSQLEHTASYQFKALGHGAHAPSCRQQRLM